MSIYTSFYLVSFQGRLTHLQGRPCTLLHILVSFIQNVYHYLDSTSAFVIHCFSSSCPSHWIIDSTRAEEVAVLFTMLPSAQALCWGQMRSSANNYPMHKQVNSNFFFLSCLFQSAWSPTNHHSTRQETTALGQQGVSAALRPERVQDETKICQKNPIDRGIPFTQCHYKIPRAVRKNETKQNKHNNNENLK